MDGLSSAHVYARVDLRAAAAAAGGGGGVGPARPVTLSDVSEVTLAECGQLVKANSIEGCKKASVTVIYTLWSNLKKDGSMATGAVSFHDDRAVRRFNVGERDKEVLARLAKTREEGQPDLKAVRAFWAESPKRAPRGDPPNRPRPSSSHTHTHFYALFARAQERERRDANERAAKKAFQRNQSAAERTLAEERRREKEDRDYGKLKVDKDSVRAEKERMEALAAKARGGGGGGGGGGAGEEEDEAVAVARAVRAVEDDFM